MACKVIGGWFSPILRVERYALGDLTLPAIAIREQAFLVVIKLFAGFGRKFEVRTLDDRVDRAGLLAHAAIDALDHVDVVARRAPRAVVPPRSGLDGDRLRRANRFAQLAGDAALFAVRISAQRMLASEAGRNRVLLERIIDRRFRLEEVAHRQHDGLPEFGEEYRARSLVQSHINPQTRQKSCRQIRCRSNSRPPPELRRRKPKSGAAQPRACPRMRHAARAFRYRSSRAGAAPQSGSPERKSRLRRSFRTARRARPAAIIPCRPPVFISAPIRRLATPRRRSQPWPAKSAKIPSSRAASTGRSDSAARMLSPSRT